MALLPAGGGLGAWTVTMGLEGESCGVCERTSSAFGGVQERTSDGGGADWATMAGTETELSAATAVER